MRGGGNGGNSNRSYYKAPSSSSRPSSLQPPPLPPPTTRDGHHYKMTDEMDQQRQDHGSNDIRHCDENILGGGRERSPADEVRDEFPIESYLGGGGSSSGSGGGAISAVPVLSNHGILPYPNTTSSGIIVTSSAAPGVVLATTTTGGSSNSAPGLEGDLNNLMIDSQNSWDVLNQNDSFGFDFNKSGEMSLSFESQDCNALDSTTVTESMDGDNHHHHQTTIDWATVAPQLDMHGNLIPPTVTSSSSMSLGRFVDSRNDEPNYHHLVAVDGSGVKDDPFAYAFGGGSGGGPPPIQKSSRNKGSRKSGSSRGGGITSDGKKKRGRGARSKKNQIDQFNMGPNPVPSFYRGGSYHGDVPPIVSNKSWKHDSQHGYNMSRGSNDYRRSSSYHPSHSNNKGRRSAPPQPRTSRSGAALLTTESGIVLTREQAPGIGWPPNEDMALQEVMSRHKSPINWDVVAKEMNFGRCARECHDRWTRYLKPGTRKGQWREEEDAIVLRVIATSPEQPFTQWADLAPMLPGRSGKQIRDRWVNYLNPAINHLPFSREDDLKLWAGHRELGKRWVEISVKIFNSTRSENHIKNRWYSAAFKKFIANEFGNCAYVDASPSFGTVSNDIAATGAAASHHVRLKGV